jgi:hypothetical protein
VRIISLARLTLAFSAHLGMCLSPAVSLKDREHVGHLMKEGSGAEGALAPPAAPAVREVFPTRLRSCSDWAFHLGTALASRGRSPGRTLLVGLLCVLTWSAPVPCRRVD